MPNEQQIELLKTCQLPDNPPWLYRNVSQTQLSIARFSGGCRVNGRMYYYNPLTDELVRDDVLKWLGQQERAAKKAAKEQAKQATSDLFSAATAGFCENMADCKKAICGCRWLQAGSPWAEEQQSEA